MVVYISALYSKTLNLGLWYHCLLRIRYPDLALHIYYSFSYILLPDAAGEYYNSTELLPARITSFSSQYFTLDFTLSLYGSFARAPAKSWHIPGATMLVFTTGVIGFVLSLNEVAMVNPLIFKNDIM
jgi:hypothetical protein